MTLIGAMLTALVMAREWEHGTLEALFVTPVRSDEILLGKTMPYFVLGLIGHGALHSGGEVSIPCAAPRIARRCWQRGVDALSPGLAGYRAIDLGSRPRANSWPAR